MTKRKALIRQTRLIIREYLTAQFGLPISDEGLPEAVLLSSRLRVIEQTEDRATQSILLDALRTLVAYRYTDFLRYGAKWRRPVIRGWHRWQREKV